MRKWEESVWEDIESGVNSEEVGNMIYKGGQMETNVNKGLRCIQNDLSDIIVTRIKEGINWDKAILSAAHLEGKFGKEIGKMNSNAPVILPLPSNQPFPPNDTPAQFSAPPVRYLMILIFQC